ncbi:hypothetical protein F2Q69_00007124 [Brassica cretica]|uniref:Protein kinase domain-containing protein n=1 Tax=Brassica cretica TaxID=69181 RepID=A0A8S9NV06_BRACR|nr:hypothetical protein F2Q69_00007124 [Brassica cretica]
MAVSGYLDLRLMVMTSLTTYWLVVALARTPGEKTPLAFGDSLQIISQRAFEAAVYKLSTAAKSPVGQTAPPPNNVQSESSLQIIDCSVFEAAGRKLPKTPKASDLSSPHVISYYGSNITPAETRPLGCDYNLILEYCSGGSIADFIKFRGTGMVESDVQLFSLHILKGINYVHSKKIIHCDIKPAKLKPVNRSSIFGCLMPNGFEPKLADFGLALRKTSDEYGDGCGFARGTLLYMAPELLCSGNLNYCADIWSYGCTILEMFTGKKPWSELGLTDRKELKDVIGNSSVLPELPMWLSDSARDFLGKCLKDPQKRYDSMYLLEHKFLASVVGHSY